MGRSVALLIGMVMMVSCVSQTARVDRIPTVVPRSTAAPAVVSPVLPYYSTTAGLTSVLTPSTTPVAQGATVTGRVVVGYGGHQPAGGVRFWVGADSTGAPVAQTDEQGRFTISGLPPGLVEIVDTHHRVQVPISSPAASVDIGILKYPLIHPPLFYTHRPVALPHLSAALAQAVAMPYTICQTDPSWSRPAASLQRATVWSKRPFSAKGEQFLQWWFRQPAILYDTMDIFTQSFPDGPSLDPLGSDWRYLLGLWNGADLTTSRCAYDSKTLEDLLNRRQIELWLLGYSATSVRRLDQPVPVPTTMVPATGKELPSPPQQQYFVQVQPAPGFQIIRFQGNAGELAVHILENGSERALLPLWCRGAPNPDCAR